MSSDFPPSPCPEAQGLPSSSKCFVARFPSSLLGLRRSKSLPAPPSKCPTWDGEVKTANHASANHWKIAKRCNTPERCMDQPSDPAAGLGSALRSLALHTSVTRRCHFSGLGPLPPDQRQEFMLPIKVRTKVKEPGQQEPSDPRPGIHRDWLDYDLSLLPGSPTSCTKC